MCNVAGIFFQKHLPVNMCNVAGIFFQKHLPVMLNMCTSVLLVQLFIALCSYKVDILTQFSHI